jgi:hypothetical protein
LILSTSTCLRCRQPQPPNPLQNRPEQFPWDRHFRHLEDYLPGMAHILLASKVVEQYRGTPVAEHMAGFELSDASLPAGGMAGFGGLLSSETGEKFIRPENPQ